MTALLEIDLERVCLEWFADLGYEILEPHNFDPDDVYEERSSVTDVILLGRLETALRHLNPDVPEDAIQQAIRELTRQDAPTLVQNNKDFHRNLTDGIEVEVSKGDGQIRGVRVRVADFENPDENDWMVTTQFTVVDRASGTGQERRPDIVLFLNGLPVAVFELKNPVDEDADVWKAFNDFQTKKKDIPSLFATNCALVISDDVEARIGSLTAPASRFGPWRTIEGDEDAPRSMQPLEVLVRGVFEKSRFLDLIHNFITFEVDRDQIIKKMAAYHQFHAVRRAVRETVRASRDGGDRRAGVIWHTQGSGKSLSMLFFARKLVLESAMANPTIVVLTDRNDLDNQLFATFSQGQALLRQEPEQAEDRSELRDLLKTESGGVYFTTMQKFLPEPGKKYPALSERRNIVVVADEAHRSQYGFKARFNKKTGEIVYGFAKHLRDALPKASFIGFTGTPVELEDKDTVKVFGEYISVYDIRRAVEDGATVPILYENRLAKVELDEQKKLEIDPEFDEITESEEEESREALKSQWSALEKLVGTDKRLDLIAEDLVSHYERRVEAMEGKALIVCMSRKICARLYEAIRKLRPHWHDDNNDAGAIKVVMTGSASDELLLKPHIRSKKLRERLAERFRDPDDPLKIVIVRDMWLTGFDAPCMHTMYVDKPMRGHNLMQAIARVNRVFGDKPGGLVVDYIGIAPFLREAMKTYTRSGGKGSATEQKEQAINLMMEHLEICRDLFHGFDYSVFFTGTPKERLALLPAAREFMLVKRAAPPEGKKKSEPDDFDRFLNAVSKLSRAFALASPHETCDEIQDEVAWFQAIRAGLVKLTKPSLKGRELDHAIRQIVSNAVVSDEVIDIFAAAGLDKPDISILSDEFLEEVRNLKHKNLAAELLQRLLKEEVGTRSRRSVIQKRSFKELLEKAIRKYQNRSVETAQVIEELIEIAKRLRDANKKGEELGLNNDEFHFYEALADNGSAVEVMGDGALASIARSLTELVRRNASIDWQYRKNIQAKLRVMVKRELKKQGYPPDAAQKATEIVLEQAKVLGINFVEGTSEAEPGKGPGGEEAKPKVAGPLPYPIAVFDSLVASQESRVLRVKTRVDGIEKTLAFVTATELALLRDANGGTMPDEVLAILGDNYGKPVSFGTWLEYAWRLAALIPAESTDPVARAARSLVNEKGKPSELTKELQSVVVPNRNKFTHGTTVSEQVVIQLEQPMHAIWGRLKEALSPLSESRLVVLSKIINFEGDDYRYSLRILQGASDHFPIEEQVLAEKMQDKFCYLLRDGKPLVLAPIVLCSYSKDTERYEVFLARTLGLESGAKVDFMSVTSATTQKLALP